MLVAKQRHKYNTKTAKKIHCREIIFCCLCYKHYSSSILGNNHSSARF